MKLTFQLNENIKYFKSVNLLKKLKIKNILNLCLNNH